MDETSSEDKPNTKRNYTRQLTTFAVTMQKGDLVVLPRKLTSQIAIGQVAGPYQYRQVNSEWRHTRPVKWLKTEIPRHTFEEDLLNSFSAFLTVCNVSRNDAARRVAEVLEGNDDPRPQVPMVEKTTEPSSTEDDAEAGPNLPQMAHDRIVARIQSRFHGHDLTQLIAAVLKAEGWVAKVSPPGPDGGVDILAGRGSLGIDAPWLCVQVKSQQSPADVKVYRELVGTMEHFAATQGLLVCWGGFMRSVLQESKQKHFKVRLWDSSDLVEAIYRNYDRLPAEIQAELPLKQIWVLVTEDPEE